MVAWLAVGAAADRPGAAGTRDPGLQAAAGGRDGGGQLRRDLVDDGHAGEAEADAERCRRGGRCPTDSPSTWPTIRRLRQPSALSVPNSGTRRDTAAMVSRLATANAAISTSTASHLPSTPASLAALAADPVISLARSAELVTVACGSRCRDLLLDHADAGGAGRGHVDRVHLVLHRLARARVGGQRLGAGQRDVHLGRAAGLRLGDDADDLELDLGDGDRGADLQLVRGRVVRVHQGHVRVLVGGGEGPAFGQRGGAERAELRMRDVRPVHAGARRRHELGARAAREHDPVVGQQQAAGRVGDVGQPRDLRGGLAR